MTYRVEVKQSQPRSVLRRKARLSMPGIAPFIQQALAELYGLVAKHGIQPAGPPSAVFGQRPDRVDEADVEVWVPIVADAEGPEELEVTHPPAVPVATTVHRGRYEDMREAYEAIDTWIAEHDREAIGPIRETYLNGPAEVDDPSEYLTKIEVPLRAA